MFLHKGFVTLSVYFSRKLVILKARMPLAVVKSSKINFIGSELMYYNKHGNRGGGPIFTFSIITKCVSSLMF